MLSGTVVDWLALKVTNNWLFFFFFGGDLYWLIFSERDEHARWSQFHTLIVSNMRVHCLINNVMQPFHHAYALCDCLFAVHLHADFLGISLSLQPSSSLDSASLFPMSPHFLSLSLFNEMTWWTQCSSSTWRQPLCCQLLRSRQLSVCLSRLYLFVYTTCKWDAPFKGRRLSSTVVRHMAAAADYRNDCLVNSHNYWHI